MIPPRGPMLRQGFEGQGGVEGQRIRGISNDEVQRTEEKSFEFLVG